MANRIVTVLDLNAERLRSGLRQVRDDVQQAEGFTNKLKAGWQGVTASFAASPVAIGAATSAAVAFGQHAVSAASDLNESINAVNVTFGESSDKILKFGEDAADAVGLSQRAFNELATPLGAILKNAGTPLDQVADKTIILTQRAADMASVFNTDVSDALSAIQAGLRGEQDPLERFGVSLSAAKVEARALADTGKDSAKSLTDLEKQTARVELILDQTNQTAGDFAETSDGLANSQRILQANLENVSAVIGEVLIPYLEDATGAANQLIAAVEKVPGLPGWLKALSNVNVVGQQITFYRKLGEAIGFVTSKWESGEPVQDRFNDSILRGAAAADAAAPAITAVGDATTATTSKVTELEQAVNDGEQAWGGYIGTVAQATSAVGGAHGDYQQMKDDLEAINREARDNALDELARGIQAVADAVDQQFRAINERFRQQDLLADIAAGWDDIKEASEDATDGTADSRRNYERQVRDQRRAVLDLLESLDRLPVQKKIELATEIETASLSELQEIVGRLAAGIVVPVTFTPQSGVTGATFGVGLNGENSGLQFAIPNQTFSNVTNVFPVGSTPTTQFVDGVTDVRRNGARITLS